jgi:hypothetical protein
VDHVLGVETQQPARGRCGGQRAGRAGGMEDPIVRPPEELTDPDADLVTGDRGYQHLLAGRPDGLSDRQRRREDDVRRMKHGSIVDIILLGDMACGCVDHDCEVGRGAPTGDQDFRRAFPTPHRLGKALDRLDRASRTTGERRTGPIHEQIFGPREDGIRDGFPVETSREFGEFAGARR